METKKYSSYAEIDHDIKALKAERDFHYQKIVQSIDKTKQSIIPSKSVSLVGEIYKKATGGIIGTVLKIAVPYAVNWFINRKRGN
ncbi:DUF6327 family protein [Flavobacterium sp.]|uniref:DUF6327 family protein n=1 Tax=Flavobacterium sp. TaxID=239 RepID=UPI0025DC122E|nr:DUF6327 family protein [Flavobacterium sp.]